MKEVFVLLIVSLAFSVEATNRKHKTNNVRRDVTVTEDDGDEGWPEPEIIKNFGVPQGFTASPPPHGFEQPSTPSGAHHHGKSHKSHSH